jgi:hypothetical protein
MLLQNDEECQGGAMKREWQVHRTVAEYPNGQRRWDYVYQFLLRWTMAQTVEPQSIELPNQENDHEGRPLCSSINQSSNAKSKH